MGNLPSECEVVNLINANAQEDRMIVKKEDWED